MQGHTTLWFRSDPVMFGAVRKLVAQTVIVAGGSRDDALELELATGEVLANAYQHAYGKTHGPLQVDLRYDDQMVEISIRDEGGVTGDGLSIPSTLADGSNHRGLYLVGQLTDHAEMVHRGDPNGGTTVRMRKYVDKLRWFTSMLAFPPADRTTSKRVRR